MVENHELVRFILRRYRFQANQDTQLYATIQRSSHSREIIYLLVNNSPAVCLVECPNADRRRKIFLLEYFADYMYLFIRYRLW